MQNEKLEFKKEFQKRLYTFILRLLVFIKTVPKNSVSDVITKQLIRSSTSILANFIEARASSSKKEFTNFFQYSLKSANESLLWLNLLQDTDNGDKKEIQWLFGESTEIAKIFASSILSLKGKR